MRLGRLRPFTLRGARWVSLLAGCVAGAEQEGHETVFLVLVWALDLFIDEFQTL